MDNFAYRCNFSWFSFETVGYNNIISQCLALSLINIGSACGAWIPIVFFADSYKSDWVARGQSVEAMDASIKYGVRLMVTFRYLYYYCFSSLGVIIGRKILINIKENKNNSWQ